MYAEISRFSTGKINGWLRLYSNCRISREARKASDSTQIILNKDISFELILAM